MKIHTATTVAIENVLARPRGSGMRESRMPSVLDERKLRFVGKTKGLMRKDTATEG